jgi:hypothetical protein
MQGLSPRWSGAGLAVLFVSLATGAAALALSRPLCCADDAAHAVIAKNVAFGLGYSDTLGHNVSTFRFTPFDPVIGTGPTIILPAALTIWLFGNEASVPGLTAVTMWALLMTALFLKLRRHVAVRRRMDAAAATFLVLCTLLSPFSAGQWFALLGEVPATLLVMLSCALVAAPGVSRRSEALGGLCLGLALAGKLLMGIYVLPILTLMLWRPEHTFRERLVRPTLFCAFAAMPLAAFELWKLSALSWAVYQDYAVRSASFIRATGFAEAKSSLFDQVVSRATMYRLTYALPLLTWVPLAALTSWAVLRARDTYIARFSFLVLAGAVLHLGYWLGVSTGNVRYAFPATLMLAAMVSLRWTVATPVLGTLTFALVLGVSLVGPAQRVAFYTTFYSAEAVSAAESDAEAVADLLVARRGATIVLTQWWATAAALEYASDTPWIFDGFHQYAAGAPGSGALVAYSDPFVDRHDRAFMALLEACGPPVVVRGPYRVHQCMQPRPTPRTGNGR